MQSQIGVVIILLLNNQILLGKRKNSYKAGYLGLPGGRVELGEPLLEAAKRELEEETSLSASNLKYLGVVREYQTDKDFLHFVFIGTEFSGTLTCREPEKCEGWSWYELDSLDASEVLPGHMQAIELWQKNKTLIDSAKPQGKYKTGD